MQLRGELLPCQGCSEAKELRNRTKLFTNNRADKPFGEFFVDLTGPKPVSARGGNKYMLIVRDDFSWYTQVFSSEVKTNQQSIFRSISLKSLPVKLRWQGATLEESSMRRDLDPYVGERRFDKNLQRVTPPNMTASPNAR